MFDVTIIFLLLHGLSLPVEMFGMYLPMYDPAHQEEEPQTKLVYPPPRFGQVEMRLKGVEE